MEERVIKIIADKIGLDASKINANSNFKDDLEADSIDLLELVMTLEEEYGIVLEDKDIEGVKTVGDVLNIIKANQ